MDQNSVKRFSSLQFRVMTATAVVLVVIMAAFALFANNAIDRSTTEALNARQSLVAMVAEAVDGQIIHFARMVEHASDLAILKSTPLSEMEVVIEDLSRAMDLGDNLYLASLTTGEVWPGGNKDAMRAATWIMNEDTDLIFSEEEYRILQLPYNASGVEAKTQTIISAPVKVDDHGLTRILMAELDFEDLSPGTQLFIEISSTSRITLVNEEGRILKSSGNLNLGDMDEHSMLLTPLISIGKAGVFTHSDMDGPSHLVAFAPFKSFMGGVMIEDLEDEVLSVPHDVRRNFILFGTIGLGVILVASWLFIRNTLKPLNILALASMKIASGSLTEQIEIGRKDEIGILARNFEIMRKELYILEQQQQRWTQSLEKQVEQRTRQVRDLLGKVMVAQEEERKRISRELHDVVAQDLAALLMTLERISQMNENLQNDDRISSIEKAKDNLRDTLKEMRHIMSGLRPVALNELGLVMAISTFAETRGEAAGLRTLFKVEGSPPVLDSLLETGLFRLMQEAINNATQHSGAQNIWIKLEFQENGVTATIEDDGAGFEISAIAKEPDYETQFGILGMKERATLLNGTLKVDSQPGNGTIVRIWIPFSL